jgi:hypothetical protein
MTDGIENFSGLLINSDEEYEVPNYYNCNVRYARGCALRHLMSYCKLFDRWLVVTVY